MKIDALLKRLAETNPKQFATAEARFTLAGMLVSEHLADRGEADLMIEIFGRRLRGEAVNPALSAKIDRHIQLAAERVVANAELEEEIESYRGDRLAKDQLAALRQRLQADVELVAAIEAALLPENVAKHYEGRLTTRPLARIEVAAELGGWMAGVREILPVLKGTVIPELERQIQELEQRIAAAPNQEAGA